MCCFRIEVKIFKPRPQKRILTWYFLGVVFQISNEYPRPLIWELEFSPWGELEVDRSASSTSVVYFATIKTLY